MVIERGREEGRRKMEQEGERKGRVEEERNERGIKMKCTLV